MNMVFQTSLYRHGKEDLIKNMRRNGLSSLSFYCAVCSFPLPAAIVFCIEEWPEHKEELEAKLERIREFYGYERIER
jgi:hypothetical protein